MYISVDVMLLVAITVIIISYMYFNNKKEIREQKLEEAKQQLAQELEAYKLQVQVAYSAEAEEESKNKIGF